MSAPAQNGDLPLARPEDALDAARYRWLRNRTSGQRNASGHGYFEFPKRPQLNPLRDLMRGSVAQHLDEAIDAAIAAKQRGRASNPAARESPPLPPGSSAGERPSNKTEPESCAAPLPQGAAPKEGEALDRVKFFWENRPTSATTALQDVMTERYRQMMVEGWTAKHDDEHASGGMAIAAACYALADRAQPLSLMTVKLGKLWEWTGWASHWFKPKDQRSNLIRAGALILAEIERLDRVRALGPAHDDLLAEGGA
jgi:hypothetical protein